MDTELNNEILDKEWEEFLDYCLSEYEFWENREQYGRVRTPRSSGE